MVTVQDLRGRRVAVMLCAIGLAPALRGVSLESLNGVWQSQGYGYVFEIKAPALRAFELTRKTCVAGFTAQQQRRPGMGWEATFQSRDEGVVSIRSGGNNDQRLLHQEDAVANIHIDRIARLPEACAHPALKTSLDNFEVFTRTFSEQYISFARRHVDWDRMVGQARVKVNSSTTPQQLFDILEALIRPLGDLHTFLAAPAIKRSTKPFWRRGTDRINQGEEDFPEKGRRTLFSMIDGAYLQRAPRVFCRGHVQYGHLDEATGYLRILSFGGYSKRNDGGALENALDSIFSDPGLKRLVIDMRLSFGGSDELGIVIANRLATAEYLAYTVQARSDPVDAERWTPGEPVMVRPGLRPGFRGRVVVLTGTVTMSAAEGFVEALTGRLPRVIRIGESTQGVFCDVLERHLPNGWTFGLPNAVYRGPDGQTLDVTGIPPDLEMRVFAEADVAARRDPVLEAAVRVLQ